MRHLILSSLILSAITVAPAEAGRWNGGNDPSILDDHFVYELNRLPTQGELPRRPWSETFWASQLGSINIRWNLPETEGFGYVSPSREQLIAMAPAAREAYLKTLSPAEKYDLFMGDYSYSLRKEASAIANPRARDWAGICDGWSIAATTYAEPQPVSLPNPDGIVIPFGASDLKGLMSFDAVRHFEFNTHQVGLKCVKAAKWLGTGGCSSSDMNPGALHVILANRIGMQQKPLIVERDPGHEIWNQPVYGFKFEILGSAAAEDGARGVRVKGTLFYTDELDKSQWEPVTGTAAFVEGKIEMDYILELDGQGRIIGGSWMSGSDRPDFVWYPTETYKFSGEMEGLNRLYKPVGTP